MEFTVMEFGVDVRLYLFYNSQVVLHVSGVADVQIKVILEVLNHVHVVVNKVISSNSWE